ncbi:sigma-70 family RNA polymerase sigma factor [Saccharopolyspora gloriosae]|uniref:sigma-70 family RNA polymerase sigma factor n=1 Tax=Saccharopolyspora gloriosae TaxID=455344 RepID=UPI001FB62D16|nr:sigma-70 family RNA polymerase sigma factor [Saccharopolyspora gloriosae]
MATAPAEAQGPSDGELIEAVRHGSTEAYGTLYERHVAAAHNMARQVARSQAEADDLVSEAFAKVLSTLRDGRGPTTAFRAYLLTSLRHVAYDRTRRERKVQLTEDVTEVSGADVSVPFTDTAMAGLERSMAARAFARLPERWKTVLWHIEIEGETPSQVGPLLGLTPNGVSALAYRAREGLRQAYLQVHLGSLNDDEPGVASCRATADRLGAWTRDGLSKRETAQVDNHLDGCDRCRGWRRSSPTSTAGCARSSRPWSSARARRPTCCPAVARRRPPPRRARARVPVRPRTRAARCRGRRCPGPRPRARWCSRWRWR